MKSVFVVFATILFWSGQVLGADDMVLKSQREKLSYTIGVYSGNGLKAQSLDVNPDIMIQGIKASLSGEKMLLTDQEMRDVMATFQKEMTAKQIEKRTAMAEKNKKAEEAFLAENKAKEGVKTLPSGLQYRVIREGAGKSPKATDGVVAHYRGTRIDGTEFDSSYQRNEPATFRLDQVIKGWTEALTLMKEGAQWQIFIPANLAYGENGAGPVEPNSTLIFDVELIKILADPATPLQAAKTEPKTPSPGAKSSKPAAKPLKPAAEK